MPQNVRKSQKLKFPFNHISYKSYLVIHFYFRIHKLWNWLYSEKKKIVSNKIFLWKKKCMTFSHYLMKIHVSSCFFTYSPMLKLKRDDKKLYVRLWAWLSKDRIKDDVTNFLFRISLMLISIDATPYRETGNLIYFAIKFSHGLLCISI